MALITIQSPIFILPPNALSHDPSPGPEDGKYNCMNFALANDNVSNEPIIYDLIYLPGGSKAFMDRQEVLPGLAA